MLSVVFEQVHENEIAPKNTEGLAGGWEGFVLFLFWNKSIDAFWNGEPFIRPSGRFINRLSSAEVINRGEQSMGVK